MAYVCVHVVATLYLLGYLLLQSIINLEPACLFSPCWIPHAATEIVIHVSFYRETSSQIIGTEKLLRTSKLDVKGKCDDGQ